MRRPEQLTHFEHEPTHFVTTRIELHVIPRAVPDELALSRLFTGGISFNYSRNLAVTDSAAQYTTRASTGS
jgi:hypothetical protein